MKTAREARGRFDFYQNQFDVTKTVKNTNAIEIAKETKFIIIAFLCLSIHEKTTARICEMAGTNI